MEILIYGAILSLGIIGAWSLVLVASIVRMTLRVRAMRGSIRKVDLLEGCVGLAIVAGTAYTWISQRHVAMGQLCALMLPFVVASLFTLLYMSERHIKNLRNIRTIKKHLDI